MKGIHKAILSRKPIPLTGTGKFWEFLEDIKAAYDRPLHYFLCVLAAEVVTQYPAKYNSTYRAKLSQSLLRAVIREKVVCKEHVTLFLDAKYPYYVNCWRLWEAIQLRHNTDDPRMFFLNRLIKYYKAKDI